MTKSRELAPQVTSDKAIVRRFQQSIATSPKDIKPGQAVYVDRLGVALGGARLARTRFAWKLGIYGAIIGGGVLALSGAWLPGAMLYVTGLTPTLVAKYRGIGTLMAIDVVLRQGHLDEGQRRLDAAPELRRRNPVGYGWYAGNIASHRGDHATALTWWREALPHSSGLRRDLLRLSIIKALLLSGRAAEARREFAAVSLPAEADPVLTGQSLTRIMFVLCDPSLEAASDDELHELARQALEYSHTGVEVAALGWAFERRGDDDMARFLAAEAADRIHYPYLATWWPALQQWLDARAATAMS